MPKKYLLILISFLIIISITGIGFAVKSQKELKDIKSKNNTQTKNPDDEVKKLVDEVGKIVLLPQGETPTIATITDIGKLKGQSFYAQAKNGNKVLLYIKAKKAFLYDPVTKKIIDIGPINIPSLTPTIKVIQNITLSPKISPTISKTVTPTPILTTKVQAEIKNIIILNGTQVVGLAGKFEAQVLKALPDAKTTKGNAKGNYKESIIIDLTGKNSTTVASLSTTLNLKISTLPGEETKTDSDIMIILGDDKSNL